MFDKREFYKEIRHIAVPITLQSLFQSSVSVIDQIMVGQLGSVSIAGAGIGGKFSSLLIVTVTGIATGSGILISQYYGSKNEKGVNDSFIINLIFALLVGGLFSIFSILFSKQIMSIYSTDSSTINYAASYLKIVSFGFIPMTLTIIISSLLRCIGYASYPMIASIISVVLNTVLNYIMIFGKLGFPALGLDGAAYATDIARIVEFIMIITFLIKTKKKNNMYLSIRINVDKGFVQKVFTILWPILMCEFLWCLGENGYAMIYGRIGTDACAAMTLTNPVQSLLIGLFSGIAAAAGIIAGKALGSSRFDDAYIMSERMITMGVVGSVILGGVLSIFSSLYVKIFSIPEYIKQDTVYILYAFSIILFVKVSNMILGGGTLRSGGNTRIVMVIDIIGTWIFGIPMGIVAAFVFDMPIYYVYFILSLEEVVRLIIELIVFKKRLWMKNITV